MTGSTQHKRGLRNDENNQATILPTARILPLTGSCSERGHDPNGDRKLHDQRDNDQCSRDKWEHGD